MASSGKLYWPSVAPMCKTLLGLLLFTDTGPVTLQLLDRYWAIYVMFVGFLLELMCHLLIAIS